MSEQMKEGRKKRESERKKERKKERKRKKEGGRKNDLGSIKNIRSGRKYQQKETSSAGALGSRGFADERVAE